MTTTISIEDNTLDRFRELKQELDNRDDGVPDHTADSFLWALLDTWEAAGNEYYTSNDTLGKVDPDAIADAVATRGVSLDVGERQKIAEEVVEVLQG